MKKYVILMLFFFVTSLSYSGVLKTYRKLKRDINTTKEIFGYDDDKSSEETNSLKIDTFYIKTLITFDSIVKDVFSNYKIEYEIDLKDSNIIHYKIYSSNVIYFDNMLDLLYTDSDLAYNDKTEYDLAYHKVTFKDAIPGLIIVIVFILLLFFLIRLAIKKSKKQKIIEAEELERKKLAKIEAEKLAKIEEKKLAKIEAEELEKEKNDSINLLKKLKIDKYKQYNLNDIQNANSKYELKNIFKELQRSLTLLNKYGNEIGNSLINHEYFIGMTIEQLIDCKGNPTNIETEVLKTKTKITYIYGNKNSGDVFVFVNGILERFKDR